MKNFFMTLTLGLFALGAQASVIQADENSIQDDLNFKRQTAPSENQRSLASKKDKIEAENSQENHSEEKGKRDIANQPEAKQEVRYWKY